MKIEVLTPSGYQPFDGMAKYKLPALRIVFYGDRDIVVSTNHTFVVNKKIVVAKKLKTGNILEHKKYGFLRIKKIEKLGKIFVYDLLDVKNGNVYYSNGILSHNCKFIGSSTTLVDGDKIEAILTEDPISFKFNDSLKIYEEVEENAKYILGIDPAEGTGKDYSTIQVFKYKDDKNIKQVAVYRNNTIGIHDFAEPCIGISDYYNNAEMMIENNSIGSALCNTIWYEYECDRIINTEKKGLGIRSDRKSKLMANLNLKNAIEKGYLTIVDETTVAELANYEEIKPGIYRGKSETVHDDTITSSIWGLWYFKTDFYDGKDDSTKEVSEDFKVESEPQFMTADDVETGYGSEMDFYGGFDMGFGDENHGGLDINDFFSPF